MALKESMKTGYMSARSVSRSGDRKSGGVTPSYGTVDCTGPGCAIEMEFMPGSDTYDCDNCRACTDAASPDRI